MNNIYSRPMFQNPQQRAGGGIMAGVAPINMEVSPARMNMGGIISEEGAINPDLSIIDWLLGGKQMEAIGAEGYLGSERMYDTTGQSIKDFIFDPDDPVDQATAALMVIPGVNIASRLLSMGLKTSRIIKQLKKVEQATKRPANISGKGATAVIAGDIALDPDMQEQIARTGELLQSIPESLAMPPGEEVISQEMVIEDPEQGGIANIATTIRQAREMKSPTFRRGDKDLAAVTAEDLRESGFETLRDYLNNMSFDKNEGRYVLKKADGGEAAIPENIEDFLESSDLTMEEFLELPEKSKKAYVDVYQQRLEMMQNIADSFPVRGIAGLADLINVPFDALGEVYDDVMHSDLAKIVGITDPDEEKPEPDPMFGEDIESLLDETAPTLEEVMLAGRPEAPAPISDNTKETIVETEEEPGFLQRAAKGLFDVVGRAAGYHLPDDEYRAYVAAHSGRRELGESRMEVYNRELAAIRDAESAARLREAQADALETSDLEKDLEFIKTQFPEVTDPSELLSLYKQFTQSSSTFTNKDLLNLRKDLYKTYLEAGIGSPQREEYNQYEQDQAGLNLAVLPYEAWAMTKVNEQMKALIGIDDQSDASVIEMKPEELAT